MHKPVCQSSFSTICYCICIKLSIMINYVLSVFVLSIIGGLVYDNFKADKQ